METSTALPVGAPMDDLVPLLQHEGPLLTVYLAAPGAVENAGLRAQRQWRSVRARLAADGAPDDALAHVDPLVEDAHLVGEALLVVAGCSGPLLVEHPGVAFETERASWAPVPDLAPLLHWRQSRIAHVTVLADRGGADLHACNRGGRTQDRVVGEGEPERKVQPGGWSQRRFQQRAENDWEHTAGDVAARAAELADRVDAEVIVLGGDVRAVAMIRKDLPDRFDERVHVIGPGRATDGSEPQRDQEVHRILATQAATHTVEVLRRFEQERGEHRAAVDGAAATIEALNRAAVGLLLVADRADERTAWMGTEPIPLALDREAASQIGARRIQEVPLTDALIRAAAGTGAGVRIIPNAGGPVAEQVGALLRWPDARPADEG